MRKKVLLLGCLIASASQADNVKGFYAGVGAGDFNYKEDSVGFDASDTAIKILAGYRFNPWVAVEGAYTDGGSPSQVIQRQLIEIEGTALSAQVYGMLPVSQVFSFIGKLGISSWEAKAKNITSGGSLTDDGQDLTYGIGAHFDFKIPLRLRLEAEGLNVDDADVRVVTASAIYRF